MDPVRLVLLVAMAGILAACPAGTGSGPGAEDPRGAGDNGERSLLMAEGQLLRLLDASDEGVPEYPDLLFRLAEHYRAKLAPYMVRASELRGRIHRARRAREKVTLDEARLKETEESGGVWMERALIYYKRIAEEPKFAGYERMDEVLFRLGDLLNKDDRLDAARVHFQRLLRDHPGSKLIPDAYLSFAEHYFNQGKVEEALKLYEQVGKFPMFSNYGHAKYMQGWCWLNLKDPRRALVKFVWVVMNRDRLGGSQERKANLIRKAKEASVVAFSHVGSPSKAWGFFQKLDAASDKGFAPKMLEKLANQYYELGKFEDSVLTFRKLMALNPRSPKLCDWQYSVVKGVLSGKSKRAQIVAARRLAATYHAIKERTDLKKSVLAECKKNAEGVLYQLGITWHRESYKSHPKLWIEATNMYQAYLDYFPGEKEAYAVTFHYAELLYKLQRWEEAARLFVSVIKWKPEGKYLEDAAFRSVWVWREALNMEHHTVWIIAQNTSQTSPPFGPLHNYSLELVRAIDRYLKVVPTA